MRLLVPGPHIDKDFVRVAGRAAYDELLDAGVEIFEYQPTMLHAKTLVVDGALVLGRARSTSTTARSSSTTRRRSASRRATSPGRSTESFEHDLERSERIDPERWERRGPVQRLGEAACTLVRREL